LLMLEQNSAFMIVVYANVMWCVTSACCEQVPQLQTYQGSCFFVPLWDTYIDSCIIVFRQRGKLLGELYQYRTSARAYPTQLTPLAHENEGERRQQKPQLNYRDVFIVSLLTVRKLFLLLLPGVQ
jgi:hypothetical protein